MFIIIRMKGNKRELMTKEHLTVTASAIEKLINSNSSELDYSSDSQAEFLDMPSTIGIFDDTQTNDPADTVSGININTPFPSPSEGTSQIYDSEQYDLVEIPEKDPSIFRPESLSTKEPRSSNYLGKTMNKIIDQKTGERELPVGYTSPAPNKTETYVQKIANTVKNSEKFPSL